MTPIPVEHEAPRELSRPAPDAAPQYDLYRAAEVWDRLMQGPGETDTGRWVARCLSDALGDWRDRQLPSAPGAVQDRTLQLAFGDIVDGPVAAAWLAAASAAIGEMLLDYRAQVRQALSRQEEHAHASSG